MTSSSRESQSDASAASRRKVGRRALLDRVRPVPATHLCRKSTHHQGIVRRPAVTRCTKRWRGQATDEQTERNGLSKRLRHTPSKSLVGRSFMPPHFAPSRLRVRSMSREAAKTRRGRTGELGPRPTEVVCIKDVDDRPPDRREDAPSFASVPRCTKRWRGQAADEQTKRNGLPKRLRHTPSKSLVGRSFMPPHFAPSRLRAFA